MKSLRSGSRKRKNSDPLITLTTDFGTGGPFVGCMKGVILGINPRARIIDISHKISSYDVEETIFLVDSFYRVFPSAVIHVVVVDPGVGSSRRPLLIQTPAGFYLGPDNGIFSTVFREENTKIWEIDQKKYMRSASGNTFHARDLFAPVAGRLSTGVSPSRFGFRIDDPEIYAIPKPRVLHEGNLQGKVIYIDKFGNLITNITKTFLNKFAGDTPFKEIEVYLKAEKLGSICEFYAEKKTGEAGAIFNSFGNLEIFSYKSNAQVQLKVRKGEPILVRC